MGKEKTHINIVVIGHVDSGRDKENWKEREIVCGTKRMHSCPANKGKGSCDRYITSFVGCYLLNYEYSIVNPWPQTLSPKTPKPKTKGPWADTKIL